MKRRDFARGLAAGSLAALAPGLRAQPDSYPNRPLRWVVPFVAGGPPDILARTLAEPIGASLGQPVVVENRPGASGNLGYEAVAKAAPDGYTLLMASINTHAINPSLYAKVPFDPIRDFTPVTQLALVHNVLVVHPDVPVSNVRELIALAKAQPGKLTFGSAGNGTTLHLSGELFKQIAGVDIVHVPYGGAPAALNDLLGGRITMVFSGVPPAMAQIKAGKLKAVAVTAGKRVMQLPDVPTVAESGLPGYEVVAWNGLAVPAGTPAAIAARLHDVAVKALAIPEVRDKLTSRGFEPVGGTPQAFAEVIDRDIAKWSKVVKLSGARID